MYIVDISPKAKKHLEAHKKSGNRVVMERIDRIMKEIKIHPQSDIGHPEKLKNDPKQRWSRHIDKKKPYDIPNKGNRGNYLCLFRYGTL